MSQAADERSKLSERNRQYWSDNATTVFEADWIKETSKNIANWIESNLELMGINGRKDQKLLDYACGDGLMSRIFLPYIAETRGLDIAEGMVNEYNRKARAAGVPEQKMEARQFDLLTEDPALAASSTTYDEYFDIAVISGAMHHVTDPVEMGKKLLHTLKPLGWLLVLDFLPFAHHHHHHHHDHDHDHHGHDEPSTSLASHPAAHTIGQYGFTEEQIRHVLQEAGFVEIAFHLAPDPAKIPAGEGDSSAVKEMHWFFVTGRRPSVS